MSKYSIYFVQSAQFMYMYLSIEKNIYLENFKKRLKKEICMLFRVFLQNNVETANTGKDT